ncbi:MAG: adenylate/guanylate cyclase domain-containing protein [Alphaproteobacteria bacterium]|nr:adenylate/guanylate cyclase domain-containing protein [Alphaproteobacteria bacterium]
MDRVANFLDQHGLGQHIDLFAEENIDFDVFLELTEDDLKELGLSLGHRKRLIRAIAAYREQVGELDTPNEAFSDPHASSIAPHVERRQVTVLFADLVGSTALSGRLDPEELRPLLREYMETCTAVIRGHEGYVAGYRGDGVLAYFGYPRAHEDDARRAVRAGLGIVEQMKELNRRVGSVGGDLSVRIGIHTGLAVVGDIGSAVIRGADTVVGDTPNIAARLQALAGRNEVVISGSTQRLVEGLFLCEDLELRQLKGVSKPVQVYRVQAESRATSRFEASVERGLTPMIGRVEEIDLLIKRWKQARVGEGQVVLISGEAGIGKSRLVRGFRERLADEVRHRLLYYGSPYHQNSALYPVIEQIERALNFEKSDTATQKLDKLETALRELDLPVSDLGPVAASLLSLPTEDRYPPLELNPQQLRKKTLETILRVLEAMAEQHPVLAVVDDAQWIDPTTVELLSLLIEQLRYSRILVLITFRPDFAAPWGDHAHMTALTINRLSRLETATVIREVAGGKDLPSKLLSEIVFKTDGVPLFIEEYTKTVLEKDQLHDEGDRYTLRGPLPSDEIPTTLKESLMARLDRLSRVKVKEVAQLAATLGRTFSEDMLAAVSALPEEELDKALTSLVDAGLIYVRGLPPHQICEFKHALVRDEAYNSLLLETRQKYHNKIANALQDRFPEMVENQPELVAHHFTEAGLNETAIDYWQRAGEQASKRSANLEAVAHLSKGLELIRALGRTPNCDRARLDRKELDMRIALNGPVIAAKGYSAPELAGNSERELELFQQIGETSQIFPVMYANWVFHITTGKLNQGYEQAQDFLSVAERHEDKVAAMVGHRLLGPASFIIGKFVSAREHLEHAIELYDSDEHRGLTVLYGQDVKAASLCYLALTLWHLGYPEQALDRGREALAQAEATAHAHTLGNALGHVGAFLRLLSREAALAKEYAEKALNFGDEHDLPVWAAAGRFYKGWALAQEGSIDDGIDLMQQGMAGLEAINFVYWRPLILACMAEAHGKLGNHARALELLNEAQDIVDAGGERWFESEIHRLKGEQHQALPGDTDAERCYRQALEIARGQKARSYELRASVSLAGLWLREGKVDEARECLAPVRGWFTEGLDTPDLKDAKAVLDELD